MSTSSSTLNSVLTALGGTTGIDVPTAVNAILYADRAPERGWQTQQTTLNSQAAALEQLEGESSALSDSLSVLQASGRTLSAAAATTSNSNVVTATAADGTVAGTHSIQVSSLASTGSWYSDAQATSSAALTAGSFDISVGGGAATTINVSGGETLTQLAAAINTQAIGVTASIVTDSSGARLALVSTASGSASDFTVANDTSVAFHRANVGANAVLSVDGVPISSASNTVRGVLDGVVLTLTGTSNTAASLNVGPDTTSISTAISSFVTAYNTLIADVNSQFKYNSTTSTAGVLQSDSAVQGLQSALLNSTNFSSSASSFANLTSLGITTNADGTLSLNSATLAGAIQNNSAAVATFFQGTANDGFASSLTTTLGAYTNTSGGAFTVDLQSISSEYNDLGNQIDTLEVYLTSQQTILTARYNAADIAIQQLPQKLKQIQALLNPNSSSSS